MIAPYLAADAAAQGDRELSATAVMRLPAPKLSDTALAELDYAVDLFQRASRATGDVLARLHACNVVLADEAAKRVSFDLMSIACLAGIAALQAREARANGL